MEPLEIILLVLGTAMAMVFSAIAILVLRRLRTRSFRVLRDDVLTFFGLLGRALLGLVLLLLFVWLLGPFGFIFWVVAMLVLIEAARKHGTARQYGLLWLLTIAAERSIPLAPAVEAFARECGGLLGRRAQRLAEMLRAGVPLPEALERCGCLLPPFALPMIRIGWDLGALAPALRQAATAYNLNEPIWMALKGKIVYLLMLPMFGTFTLVFIMIKVVPSYQKIFDDFGTTLPPMTRALIGVSNVAVTGSFLFFPIVLFALLVLVCATLRYLGWSDADIPGAAWFTRRLDSAQILDTLSLVADQQRPLPEGIAALARFYPKKNVRRRLRQALADIEVGRNWCESLLWQGLIRQPQSAILQAAQRAGNLPWAMREMADSGRRRLAYRVQAISQAVLPPIVILMGLAVMFIVVALFLPLISLIQALA